MHLHVHVGGLVGGWVGGWCVGGLVGVMWVCVCVEISIRLDGGDQDSRKRLDW